LLFKDLMFKKILFFYALLICFVVFPAKAQRLSEQSKISLLTMYPGEELYSSFGHSAFWVFDPSRGVDRVYNYGTFSFEEPNFYGKFITGKLLYRLSVSDIEDLLWGYRQENREVVEQVLNLSLEKRNKLFEFLETNYLPQNRAYKYDFFFDNCSSRLRDGLKTVCGDSVQFVTKTTEDRSFRQLLDPFLTDKQWQDLGMDTGLGTPSDKIASRYDYMFLPIHLMNSFDSATILSNGREEPLVKAKNVLFKAEVVEKEDSILTPNLFFWLLFFIVALFTFLQLRKEKFSYFFDSILLVFTGLLGFLIVFLWFGTDHKVTANNWNLIWAMPLNFFMLFFLKKDKNQVFVKNYFLAYGICLILLLISWNLIPQEINIATFPFILVLALRAFFIFYKLKNKSSR
jgi:hypothetical protein